MAFSGKYIYKENQSQYSNTYGSNVQIYNPLIDYTTVDGTTITFTKNVEILKDFEINNTDTTFTCDNLEINGDFKVNGTATYINSTTVSIVDPLFKLASNNIANTVDIGCYGKYTINNTAFYGGWFLDSSDSNKFKIYNGLTSEPTTLIQTTDVSYTPADLEIGNLYLNGSITSGSLGLSGSLTITDTTESESTTTGSIITAGGVGIGKKAYIGDQITCSKNINVLGTGTAAGSSDLAAIHCEGGITTKNNIICAGYINSAYYKQISGATTYLDCNEGDMELKTLSTGKGNDATSYTSGDIMSAGGISCQKQLRCQTNCTIGGNLNIVGSSNTFTSTIEASSPSAAATVFSGGVGIGGRLYVNNPLTCFNYIRSSNTQDSTDFSTGCIRGEGGLYLQKSIYIGGTQNRFISTDDATSSTSAPVMIAGGLGVDKKLYVGDTLTTTNTITGGTLTDGTASLTSGAWTGITTIGLSGSLSISDTTESTSTTTGSIITAGGIGVGKSIYTDNVVLLPRGVPPSSPIEGMLYYNSLSDTLQLYDGSDWQIISFA